MTWLDYASKTRSTKIALAHIFPKQRWKEWALVSGFTYSTQVEHNVFAVANALADLVQYPTSALDVNTWYFDPVTKTLYVNVGAHPKTVDIILTYKLCFASAPVNLPHDLDTGFYVEYDSRIKDIGELKLELDYENAGIALESSSSISMHNSDGYFDGLFDRLIWENQRAVFYSYGLELDPALSRVIFDGFVDTKSFSTNDFKLGLKDAFKRLRERVQLPLFTAADGTISDSVLNKPKRRIYGRMSKMKCVGIDNALDGFELTGIFSSDIGLDVITGTGTDCLNECSPGDDIKFVFNGEEFSYSIQSVDSATQITVSQAIEAPLSGALLISPQIPYRGKNRLWHVAGHKCHDIETTVTEFITPTRLRVSSVSGFEAADRLDYNSGEEFLSIQRITGDVIVLDQAIAATPAGGESLVSPAVREVYIETTKLEPDRDYSFTNTSTDCVVVLDPLAEFNITKPFKTVASFTFTNGSRTVTSATTNLDLSTILRPRDWIRAFSITRPEWYEILAVKETEITLRTPFTAASFTGNAERKNVSVVSDSSLVTVDVNGKRGSDLRWISTAAQAVKDILENDLGVANISESKFTEAEADAPDLISYAIPESPAGSFPIIRDAITNINRSVFGALYQNSDFDFEFSVLQSDKDEAMPIIREDDILSYSAQTKQQIMNLVRVLYRPAIDLNTREATNAVYEFQNEFVDRVSGIKNTLEQRIFLYRDSDAETYAERLAFFRSLTNTNIIVKGKINLVQYGLGQKVLLDFDRMFVRYGNASTKRVGIVYGVSTDEGNSTLSMSDFNAVFTRVPAVAPDDAADFSSASDSDVARWGYVCDDFTETPDGASNASLGNNLIG